MTTLRGRIVNCETYTLGGEVVSAGGSGSRIPATIPMTLAEQGSIVLANGADFNQDGGQVLINGVDMTYNWCLFDPDTGYWEMNLPSPVPVVEDDFAAVFPIGQVKKAKVYLYDDSDVIDAIVPFSFMDKILDGIREPGEEEECLVGDNNGRWEVVALDGTIPSLSTGVQVFDPVTGEVLAYVSDQGEAQFHDLTLTGQLIADVNQFIYGGQSLKDWLDEQPRGIVAYGQRSIEMSSLNTENGVINFRWTSPPDAADRLYRLCFEAVANSTTADQIGGLLTRWRATTAPLGIEPSPPTIASAQMLVNAGTGTALAGERYMVLESEVNQEVRGTALDIVVAPNTEYSILLTVDPDTDTTNVDLGEFIRAWVEDVGPRVGNTGTKNTGGGTGTTDTSEAPVTVLNTYTKEYIATASAWYTGSNTYRGDTGTVMYFGYTSTDGNRKAVIWFDKNAIMEDLAGAVVTKVEAYLYLSGGDSGNIVAIGKHNDVNPQLGSAYTTVASPDRQIQTSSNWNEGTGRWVNLNASGWAHQSWRTSGGYAGLVIGPESSQVNTYAGSIRGAGHALGPKLRITYQK
jgi:hypothetical protein